MVFPGRTSTWTDVTLTGSCLFLVWAVLCWTVAYAVSPSPLNLPCEKSSAVCGRPSVAPVSTRIIGGKTSASGSWPWMVSILEDGFLSCGGAVIAPDLVITAAHCFIDKSTNLSTWKVVAGKYRLDRYEPGQVAAQVKEIRTHAWYNRTTIANDIALVLLEKPLTFSDQIKPICLPRQGQEVKEGEMCLLAGWGSTRDTSDPNALNQVPLPIVSDSTCGKPDWYGAWFSEPNTTFCAGYAEGLRDGCTGDSGGPLICWREDSWYIQGISSWAYGCAEKKWPGVYTEVDKYQAWIEGQVISLRGGCPANAIVG